MSDTTSSTPTDDERGPPLALAAAAFLALGFCIGGLTGMTASAVAPSLIAALFTFSGGAALIAGKNLSRSNRIISCVAILAMSLGTAAGVVGGIALSEHSGLAGRASAASSTEQPSTPSNDRVNRRFLLRNRFDSATRQTLQRWERGELKSTEAVQAALSEDFSDQINDVISSDRVASILNANQSDSERALSELLKLLALGSSR